LAFCPVQSVVRGPTTICPASMIYDTPSHPGPRAAAIRAMRAIAEGGSPCFLPLISFFGLPGFSLWRALASVSASSSPKCLPRVSRWLGTAMMSVDPNACYTSTRISISACSSQVGWHSRSC
jgi:hypothetical protein